MIDDRDESWKLYAACRDEGPRLFFPPDSSRQSREQTNVAKQVCAGCPVQIECLDYGWKEVYGTWGGMTARERLMARRRIYREQRAWALALTQVIVTEVTVRPGVYDERDADTDARLIET